MKKESVMTSDKIFTIDEALQVPGLKHLAEDVQHLEKDPQRSYRTQKYLQAQKSLAKISLLQLRTEHPEWHLKDCLAVIVKAYPANLPSDILQAMTQYIIGTWEKLDMKEQAAA
jgi:hypothetical protein